MNNTMAIVPGASQNSRFGFALPGNPCWPHRSQL
jgi:hypothetical protein